MYIPVLCMTGLHIGWSASMGVGLLLSTLWGLEGSPGSHQQSQVVAMNHFPPLMASSCTYQFIIRIVIDTSLCFVNVHHFYYFHRSVTAHSSVAQCVFFFLRTGVDNWKVILKDCAESGNLLIANESYMCILLVCLPVTSWATFPATSRSMSQTPSTG